VGEKAAGNIILTGFSYTGKTKVGQKVAWKLGLKFLDIDEEIVRSYGKPIAEIFARDGEERFRELESKVLERVCQGSDTVIATGGGAVMSAANRDMMLESGVVICLEAKPATIYRRLLKDAEDPTNREARPLLAGPEPLRRIEWLKGFRQPYYALADWTVHTDNLTVEEVADEVVLGWRYGRRGRAALPALPDARESDAPYCEQKGAACVVTTATESYPVFVGWGFLEELGRRMRNAGLWGTAHIMSDEVVFPLYHQLHPSGNLETLYGVGEESAAVFLSFFGDPSRFPNGRQMRGWSGMVPNSKQSADNESKGLHISQAGPDLIKKFAYLDAEVARRYDPQLAAIYYDQMVKKGKHHTQAVCAVATHLLDRVWVVLVEDRPYDLRDVDGTPLTPERARKIIAERYTVPEEVRKRNNRRTRRARSENRAERRFTRQERKRESSPELVRG